MGQNCSAEDNIYDERDPQYDEVNNRMKRAQRGTSIDTTASEIDEGYAITTGGNQGYQFDPGYQMPPTDGANQWFQSAGVSALATQKSQAVHKFEGYMSERSAPTSRPKKSREKLIDEMVKRC